MSLSQLATLSATFSRTYEGDGLTVWRHRDGRIGMCQGQSGLYSIFPIGHEHDPNEVLFQSADLAVASRALTLVCFIMEAGLGFHPDTRGRDYVDADGARTLSNYDAAILDIVVNAWPMSSDIYGFSMAVWSWLDLL